MLAGNPSDQGFFHMFTPLKIPAQNVRKNRKICLFCLSGLSGQLFKSRKLSAEAAKLKVHG